MRVFKSVLSVFVFLFCLTFSVFSQDTSLKNEGQSTVYTEKQKQLRVTASNIRLFADKKNGGYHLYVKKLPGVNSILLTETTKDPTGKNDSYAYRAKEYNKINGDEIRILDGKPLVSEGAKYSLVDSTVENTSFMGEAFHIYIPETLVYGYDWSRKGEVEIQKGTFINIRSFEKPYADYTGDYVDNPFMFDFVKKEKPAPQPKKVVKEKPAPKKEEKKLPPAEPDIPEEVVEDFVEPQPEPEPEPEPAIEESPDTVLTDDYNPLAYDKFKEVSEDLFCSKGPEDLIETIKEILEEYKNSTVDVVLTIDTTGSMKNDMDKLKKDLVPMLEGVFTEPGKARVGLLLYRDYGDSYNYMNLPVKPYGFMDNMNAVGKILNGVKINGKEGGDVPEAVYEALYASAQYFQWRSEAKKRIILIGDAEPHPLPRKTGKYSREFALKTIAEKGAEVTAILLPRD